jgi:NitT/TauT family transport system substrate-binding protein
MAAAAGASYPNAARAQSATVIRIASTPIGDAFCIPYYADAMGFFKKAGLNVELQRFPSNPAISLAVASGAADVGIIDPMTLANAYNRGVSWAYFADGPLYPADAQTSVLAVGVDSPIHAAKDLEGKAIGTASLNGLGELACKAWIDQNGGDASKTKFVQFTYAAMVPALNRGDLAGVFIAEPFLSDLRNQFRVLANVYDSIAKSFIIAGTFASRSWLTQNAAAAKQVAAVFHQTGLWANSHHDDSAVILSKESGLPLEKVRSSTRARFGPISTGVLQPVLDAAFKYKEVEKPVRAGDILVSSSS